MIVHKISMFPRKSGEVSNGIWMSRKWGRNALQKAISTKAKPRVWKLSCHLSTTHHQHTEDLMVESYFKLPRNSK